MPGAPTYQAVPNTKLMWVSNTDADIFRARRDGAGLLPRLRPMVHARRISRGRGRSPRSPCQTTSRRSRSSIRVRACSRPCRARRRPPRPSLLASVPQTARVNKKQLKGPDVRLPGRSRSFSRSNRPRWRARSTPTRTSSASAIVITCATRACGFLGDREWSVGSGRNHPERDLRHPRQLLRPSRHLRDRRRG